MEVKANVQKRRQDRIKALQNRNFNQDQLHAPAIGQGDFYSGSPAAGSRSRGANSPDKPELTPPLSGTGTGLPERQKASGGQAQPPGSRDELPLWVRGPLPAADHGGDPEVAWKQRQKELLEWYSGRESQSATTAGQSDGSGGSRYGGGGPMRKLVAIKLSAAILLFLGTWGMFSLNTPWAHKGQAFVTDMLTTEMRFTQVAAWYNRTFSGAPSFLPAFGDKQEATKVQGKAAAGHFVQPVKGTIAQAFTEKKEGLWLATRPNAQVASMDEGRIEFAGDKEGTGHTLIIRHTDGYRTTYGGLAPTKWETGDWLKSGEVLGTAAGTEGQGLIFLSVMRDGSFINPLDVVSFD